jgi:hypothetical protein
MRGHERLRFLLHGAILLAALLLQPLAAHAAPVLTGDSIAGSITHADECVQTQLTSPAVVGAGVEFNGAFSIGKVCGYSNFLVSVDFAESSFTVAFTAADSHTIGIGSTGILLTMSFTGLDFTPGATITSVSCSGPDCFPNETPIGFTANSVVVSWKILKPGDTYVFDLATSDAAVPAPEPTSLVLLGTGLASVIVRRARRGN